MALYHCVHSKSLFVVVFVGPCPFRFLLCLSAGWRNASGWGICVSPLVWLFLCLVLGFMICHTTSNCFFTYKDRALDRDRPHQRKKCLSPEVSTALASRTVDRLTASGFFSSSIDRENSRRGNRKTWLRFVPRYGGGPHMRSLISIDFPAPEMEPESAHVASAVSVP